MKAAIYRFLCAEDGPTAVEYAVMLASIVAICLAGIHTLGQGASESLQSSSDQMQAAGLGQN